MDYSKKEILTFVLMLCASSCTSESSPSSDTSVVEDAQFICDVLTQCFDLELGGSCADDIASTTADRDVRACALCYEQASCDDIGEPGTPGVCDDACQAALFGGAS